MLGYTVCVKEILEQLPAGEHPSHIFMQAGCGGLAGAVCAYSWQHWKADRPRFVVVEPEKADCLYQSMLAGSPIEIDGNLDTIMGGLACGKPSLLAWDILSQGADDFITIPDDSAIECMRLLANGIDDDPPIVAGESAVGGIAGLLCVLGREKTTSDLGLNAESKVLVVGTEGATDPDLYNQIVGRSAETVRASR
jgi:diaminopropionate ammonia-lyase